MKAAFHYFVSLVCTCGKVGILCTIFMMPLHAQVPYILYFANPVGVKGLKSALGAEQVT